MKYRKGQQLLMISPILTTIVAFVGYDEGWVQVQFRDKSEATVRPSRVQPLDADAMEAAIGEYQTAIFTSGSPLEVDRMSDIVEEVAEAIGYDNHARLHSLHTMAEMFG